MIRSSIGAEPDEGRWPLHERLLGVLVRAMVATAASMVPLAFALRASEEPREIERHALVGLVAALSFFVFERRDSTAPGSIGRAAGGALVAAISAPAASAWLDYAHGGFRKAVDAFQRLNEDLDLTSFERWEEIFERATLMLLLAAPLLIARRCTNRPLPQLIAGVATGTFCFLALVIGSWPRARADAWSCVWFLECCATSAGLVAVGTVFGDRLARRFDPRAPLPSEADRLRLESRRRLADLVRTARLDFVRRPRQESAR